MKKTKKIVKMKKMMTVSVLRQIEERTLHNEMSPLKGSPRR